MATRHVPRAKMVATLSVALLIACTQGVDVDVMQRGDDVDFYVREFSSSADVCVKQLDVSIFDSETFAPVWELTASDRDSCIGKFTYGREPKGFSQTSPAIMLVKGQTYRLDVTGTGFSGGELFVVGARDGPIGRD